MEKSMDRRDFVKAAGVASAIVAGAGMVKAASAEEAAEVAWEAEADVVIVGAGIAGMSCAATVGIEGLGTALMLEAAPQEFRGGNAAATQGILFCPDSADAALEYQASLNGGYTIPEDVFQAWAEEIVQNKSWLEENFGCEYEPCKQGTWGIQGEYPFMPRAQECPSYTPVEGTTWNIVAGKVDELSTPIYYEARAIKLIQDETGRVIGVECEDGRCFKALKGVLLACGGFEANADMMKEHLPTGYTDTLGKGSWFNRGDGIKMVQRIGGQLWHMNNVSGAALGFMAMADGNPAARTWTRWATKNYIFVDERGRRFRDEDTLYTEMLRHGKQYREGVFTESSLPTGAWAIFGDEEFNSGKCIFSTSSFSHMKACEGHFTTNQEGLDAGVIIKCDDFAALAEATGIDAGQLELTINYYNEGVDAGADPFGRGQDKNEYSELMTVPGNEDGTVARAASELSRIEAPYYAIALVGTVLNTQGGPKRSANCEILDLDDQPIPGLYGAGEGGCEYPYIYNVGGNISEGVSSGRRAARVICGQ